MIHTLIVRVVTTVCLCHLAGMNSIAQVCEHYLYHLLDTQDVILSEIAKTRFHALSQNPGYSSVELVSLQRIDTLLEGDILRVFLPSRQDTICMEFIQQGVPSYENNKIKGWFGYANNVSGGHLLSLSYTIHGSGGYIDWCVDGIRRLYHLTDLSETETALLILGPQSIDYPYCGPDSGPPPKLIYPNPTTGEVYISGFGQGDIWEVQVFDTGGHRLYHAQYPDPDEIVDLDVTRYPPGVYFVMVKSVYRQLHTFRLIKL